MELIEGEGEGSSELMQGHAYLWNHIFSFGKSMSLKCAVQLGIPDIIHNHGRPMTLSELVDALPIASSKATCVHRLMRLMVHSGIFALQKNGDQGQGEGYVLTPTSRLLLKKSTTNVSPFLLMMLDPVIVTPWNFMSAWFQGSEEAPFETAHGASLWDCAAQSPDLSNSFNEAMASDARLIVNIIFKEYGHVFQGLRSLVDVGGGNGTAASVIAEAFPHVKCTVFDLPHVVSTLQKSTKLDFVGGDMFESIPPADAIFLKWILHDWSDEECVKILKRCKDAIPSKEKGGKVIILEIIVDVENRDHRSIETQLFWDMLMMMESHGRERSENKWRKIFTDAGFSHCKMTPIFGMRSVIEVYP